MDNVEKIAQARRLLNPSMSFFGNFVGHSQRLALLQGLRGEEWEAIADLVINAAERIKATPTTYKTQDEEDKTLCLHYFRGGIDAWIVERDVGDTPDNPDSLFSEQIQAFGKITLMGGGWDEAEWGYINIQELIDAGVEFDLYWHPKKASEM